MMRRPNIDKAEILLFFLVIIFLIIEISFIKLPGIYADEADAPGNALAIKECFSRNFFLGTILNKQVPLMRGFHGALDAYILSFVFTVFPVCVESMRLMAIFFSVLTIFLTYFFTKMFFNKNYALITILLLVINPGFVMGTKIGVDNGAIMASVYMGILLCLLRWYRLRKNIYFCFAMFLLGLGMWTRIWFFWFIFGIFLTAIIFKNNIKQRFEINKTSVFLKYITIGVVFFSLGCSIIIYNEYTSNFSTVKYVLACLRNPSLVGAAHNNLQYFRNLSYVMTKFSKILTGQFYFEQQFLESGCKFVDNHYPLILLISIIYLFTIAIVKKGFHYKKNVLFILTLFIGMLILTPISHQSLPWYHFYFFFPLVQLIISVAIVSLIRYARKFKIIMIVVVILSLSFIAKELNGLRGYFYYLKETGGKQYFSPAIYDLTEYLLKERRTNVIVGGWGLHNVMEISSGGRIHAFRCSSAKDCEPSLQDKNNLFIFYPKEVSSFENILDDFIFTAKQLNINLVEKKRFYEKDGNLIYIVMNAI